MKKKIFAVLTVVLFALGGCADSAGENVASVNEGASDSVGGVTANDEVQSMAESMAEDMAESMAQSMFESRLESMSESETEATTVGTTAVTTKKATETTTAEAEDKKQIIEEYNRANSIFVRTSEDESTTLTIDSDIFPYDCEEIIINVDTEAQIHVETEGYEYLDLENLKNYPNLKRLEISDMNNQAGGYIKIINGGSAACLKNLDEIKLHNVTWWDEDWLSGISSLKKLSIEGCREFDGGFPENLSQVETLYIDMCPIDDLSFINGMGSLRELTVEFGVIGNSSFNAVEENYSLEKLTIGRNFIFDPDNYHELTDIMGLRIFRRLEYLELPNKYGEKQIKALQEMLPECEINY